jgi:hypothetical protein
VFNSLHLSRLFSLDAKPFEYLNPNIEIRNPKQIRMFEIQNYQAGERRMGLPPSVVLVIGKFGFSICFEFRASDFEFFIKA